jgi:ribosomal subunit interface protein
MEINIKATNTTLTPGIREDIENKLTFLEEFLKDGEIVHVELSVDAHHKSGDVQRAEVRIQPHGHYAEASAEDFYIAMDKVAEKIKEQVSREKDKKVSLRRKLGAIFKRNSR